MARYDPFILLCESCGYPIGELPRAGACPECGGAIAESLPERRVGTAWQRNPGVGSWLRTIGTLAIRPVRTWDVVRARRGASIGLLLLNCALASAGLCLWLGVFIAVVERAEGRTAFDLGLTWLAGGVTAWAGIVVGLLALSFTEFAGIRFFGRRRGWRTTNSIALAVVGHASVGWLLLPIALPLCWWLAYAANATGSRQTAWVGRALELGALVCLVAGPLIPLLAFETLIYLGFRRMRFANTR